MKKEVYLGVDLGGTKIALGLVSPQGKLLSLARKPTRIHGEHPTGTQLISTLSEAISEQSLLAKDLGLKVKGLGLASAGPMNIDTGELIEPANLRNIRRFALCERLQSALKKKNLRYPLFFQNDAMAAAFAEAWLGQAKKTSCSVMITVGTGIGAGVLRNNEALQNKGQGSEWGHCLIGSQTVEEQAAGPAILARASKYLGKNFVLWDDFASEMKLRGNLPSSEVSALFTPTSEALATLCYNLSLGVAPDVITFSGGVMRSKKYFWPELQTRYKTLMKPYPKMLCPLKQSTLKEPGVLGAAWMVAANKYRVSF
jgi:glucokinase